MAKYLILMTSQEGEEEPFCTGFINMLFDNREDAEREMKKCIEQEVERLSTPDCKYYSGDNYVIGGCGYYYREYSIAEITKEFKKG